MRKTKLRHSIVHATSIGRQIKPLIQTLGLRLKKIRTDGYGSEYDKRRKTCRKSRQNKSKKLLDI